jgi:hypothetical protein
MVSRQEDSFPVGIELVSPDGSAWADHCRAVTSHLNLLMDSIVAQLVQDKESSNWYLFFVSCCRYSV